MPLEYHGETDSRAISFKPTDFPRHPPIPHTISVSKLFIGLHEACGDMGAPETI